MMPPWDSLLIRTRELARRFGIARLVAAWPFVVLVCLITWLLGFAIGEIPENIEVGAIAPYDIRADRQYTIVNEIATKERQAEAMKQAKTVYDYDVTSATAQLAQINTAFQQARESLVPTMVMDEHRAAEMRGAFEDRLGLRLTDAQWQALVDLRWDMRVQQFLERAIHAVTLGPVVENLDSLRQEQERGIIVRTITVPAEEKKLAEELWKGEQLATVRALDQLRKEARATEFGKHNKAIQKLAETLMQTNCAPNLLATEERRVKMMEEIPPVVETIQSGASIARRYEPYSEEQARILRAIQHQKSASAWPVETIGYLFYTAIILALFHSFAIRHIAHYRPTRRDLFFLGAMVVVMLAIVRSGGLLGDALAKGLPLPIPPAAYYYIIPLATGGMMIRFLLNAETALLFSVVLAAFAGIVFPQDPSFTTYVLAVSTAGAMVMRHVDKRSAIIRSGIYAGAIAVVVVGTIHLMRAGLLGEMLTPKTLIWHVTFAFIGALLSAIMVMALTPLVETVFDYTSDIKLLELANLNHPLLRELVIRAPGTYHHSHLVGILAEAGASAIGANPLLARVGAYYHDIGKIRKPMYFTENQKAAQSPHERLNPHMSALIIASHVKEGMELARTYKLPQVIIDMIPQHHGTKMIGYFYELAKETADPSLGEVDEKEFRYPGPKPQSREAGLLLLADGVEGAVRALKEKSPTRIQQTVEAIINKSFAEGQLDECELTLKNLNEIGNAFTRILLGIYHQRVEYPREVLQLREKDVTLMDTREHDEQGG